MTLEEYPALGKQTTVAKCGRTEDKVEGDTPDYAQYFHPDDTKHECVNKATTTTSSNETTITREVVLQKLIVALDKPTDGTALIYNGTAQNGVEKNEGYTLTGDVDKMDVGNYTTIVTLKDGYKWKDGSTDAVTV